jgi:deazaflavin-dependent oxidoreductase (nitroreductase family)
MADVNDFNKQIIEEFRANGGNLGGPFEGAPMLLLHHKGAKTGAARVNPVAYRKVGENLAIFASKAGAPTNPDWYYNLIAHPETEVEVGTETIPVIARVADNAEREPIWEANKRDNPGFADYEKKTTRQIPVIILERANSAK